MIVFSDVDGCITTSYKIHLYDGMAKAFSDKDSVAIEILRNNKIPLILISGDKRINESWACSKNIAFHHEPKNKWARIQKTYWKEIEKPWVYIGDAMPDFECLKNATYPFVPADCSKILIKKLLEAEACPIRLSTNGGAGVLDDVVCRLYEMGELKI